ncbi:YwiC-like family protein [Effusibacillus pohliae]|uniref:YwiC-like family protein n=1 Tax=Effusibacillus pohliae TaxID=232270 RepID=UPI0003677874|nr:YwiC-like family protein [Effusibacillus pohliae]
MKIVLPREHGAWGMLLAPWLVGASHGGWQASHVWLLLAMLAAYLATYPLLMWIKNPRRNGHMKRWAAGYVVAAGCFSLPLLWRFPALLALAAPACLLLAVNIRFAKRKRERQLLNDLAAICGLSLGAMASYFVGRQVFDFTAFALWLSCVLLFFGSALYVKSLIRERGNRKIKIACNLYHTMLVLLPLLANGLYPAALPVGMWAAAYAFAAGRAWLTRFDSVMRPLAVGLIEIANTVWFVLVVSLLPHIP